MQIPTVFLALIASASAVPALTARDFGGPPITGEVCPQAQDLFYRSNSGRFYQMACSVDVGGADAIAVYEGVVNAVDCAQ
jgi:hypothetical protein